MVAPLLSICIPTCNRCDWLKACLDACLPQVEALPVGQVEVVVSDNASTDRTPDLLREYAAGHPRLVVHRNEVNNHAVNFDTVLEFARGEFAWLMGDDDALLPGALAHVVELIRTQPRDLYLPHVVVDSTDPQVNRMEWFDDLSRLDWDLSDPGQLREYMSRGRSASAVFSFISILIFRREPWLAASARRPREFYYNGWPQVATGLEYVKGHGRLRIIPEALVNYHCSTGAWGEPAWDRAMLDLRGLLEVADAFFPDAPALHRAFMGNLRKNHGDGWIAHHRISAPSDAAWAESRALLLRAGFDPVQVAAVDLAGRVLAMNAGVHPGLDADGLVMADLGFILRGARRILVLAGAGAGDAGGLAGFLGRLRAATRAEVRFLAADPTPAALPAGIAAQPFDPARFARDPDAQRQALDATRTFAPDLVLNLDPARRPAWDLLAGAAGALACVAFQAGQRPVTAEQAQQLDRPYTRLLPAGTLADLADALGLAAPPASDPSRAPSLDLPPVLAPAEARTSPHSSEASMKLNLGCGNDHLSGWVNVDKFAAARPDVVHDLERFPWPFQDSAAEEVLLKHVLEHLGRDGETFMNILKELYRICQPGATVRIVVPHPRHQDFLQDPTHVRPVLGEMFEHFSLDSNEEWGRRGLPGTPLARYLGVDFKVESVVQNLDLWWDAEFRAGRISRDELERAIRDRNNVVQTTEIVLTAQKPFRGGASPKAPAVRWEGSQFVYHSLAHVNRQLCLRLLGSGRVNLSLVPYEPDRFDGNAEPAFRPLAACVNKPMGGPAQVHVRHQWPPRFDAPEEGAWVIIQPWEYGGIPQEWIGPMRDQVDEIWVPTAWLKDCYVRSGIPEGKVVVVPNGVDGEVFRPEGERFPLRTRKSCKFLFVGGTIRRKGIDVLLEAYVRAFRAHDDVCLVIKGQGGGVYGAEDLPAILARFRAEDPGGPEIEYRSDDLNEEQVAALYRSCDALVLPYRGEGFGLPIAEAMASGLPVIVTGRGAGMDFVRGDCAYLIPSRTVTVQGPPGFTPGPAGFWLEEPDPASLADLLRQAYQDPAGRRDKGRRAREHALAELGWEKPAAIAVERLEQLALRQPRRNAPPEPPPASEAFLYRPDWASAEWAEVLMSYLLAFKPGEPVVLVLPWAGTAGEPGLAEIQGRVLQLAQGAGLDRFPDVALVDQPGTLPELLAKYGRVTEVPRGRGAVAGLDGTMGRRLAAARSRMVQG